MTPAGATVEPPETKAPGEMVPTRSAVIEVVRIETWILAAITIVCTELIVDHKVVRVDTAAGNPVGFAAASEQGGDGRSQSQSDTA